jgi:cytidine deaminase
MTAHDRTLGLEALPDLERSMVADALAEGPFFSGDLVEQLTADLGIDIGQLMIALVPAASSRARVPLSNFFVGAIARGSTTGSLYLGANMEFPSHALSFSVHGEQSAANNAWLHDEEGLHAVAVNEVPCGYCRQFLNELAAPTGLQVLLKSEAGRPADYSYSSNPLSYYLQDSFGPVDLGVVSSLMDPQSNGLSVDSTDPLVRQALHAANSSYSPYTANFAGVALRTSSKKTYTGRYAENAAFNPSMSPLQSAVASLNMHEPAQTPYNIESAVLVEAADSKISQLSSTLAVLSSIAPDVKLQHVPAG